MNQFSDQDLVVGGLVGVGVGLVLTPIFGIWVWIALIAAAWMMGYCLAQRFVEVA